MGKTKPKTRAIVETVERGDRVHGRPPQWRCPFCGEFRQRASLEVPRPDDVADACPCGAVPDADYAEASHERPFGPGNDTVPEVAR